MISQIYISALIVTSMVLFIVYFIGRWGRLDIKKVLLVLASATPLSAIVNIGIKRPVILYLFNAIGASHDASTWPAYVLIVSLLVVGLSEEAIKMAPAIIPFISKILSKSRYYKLAFSWIMGVGFGLGEAYYIAYAISLNPVYSGYPYYYFTGYMNERIVTCLVHGMLTVIALYGWPSPKKIIGTYFIASIIHAAIDIPPALYQIGLMDIALAEISTMVIGFISIVTFLFILNRARDEEFREVFYRTDLS